MNPLRGRLETRLVLLFVGAVAAGASGCASRWYDEADDAYWANDPQSLLDAYREAVTDRGPNALIGVEKLLSAALLQNDWRNAESLAVRASTLVNIYTADEPGERDALGLFGQEKDKPFKGEPHERLMVDYYLGLLRYRRGDYEGALAAFRSAMQKDRGSYLIPVEKERARRGGDNAERFLYEDDSALLHFLAARCYVLLDEPEEARRSFERACEILPRMRPLFEEGLDPRNNVLVIVEGGSAPAKRQTGPGGAILAYARGEGSRLDRLALGSRELSFGQVEDLYEQATTVGGRQVDAINKTKAERQQILSTAGFATAATGYMIAVAGANSRNREMQAAGLIGLGVGIMTMIFADVAIDPGADLRAWGTLPGQVYLGIGRASPGPAFQLQIAASSGGGQDLSQAWNDVPVTEGSNLFWTRLLPGRRGGPWTPPPPARPEGAGNPAEDSESPTAEAVERKGPIP